MGVDIYLASRSARRQQLLKQLGVRFELKSQDVPELLQSDESAEQFVQRLAYQKAASVVSELEAGSVKPVLGADTVVTIEGQILGKPASREQGIDMLRRLSGQTHKVLTGVAIISGDHSVCVNVSEVTFRQLTDAEIDQYWLTGEPMGKAGAYAIQGYAAAFIEKLTGSYSGVMGLPLYETAQLLNKFGVPVWQKR